MAHVTYALLRVGTKTLRENEVPTHPDAADGFFALRAGRKLALLVLRASLDDLSSDDDEATEELVSFLGADLLAAHDDPRGVLVASSGSEPKGETYDDLVAELAPSGRWVRNGGRASRVVAAEDEEIPVPGLPKARGVEVYVLSPARAMRELSLDEAPLRVVCRASYAAVRPVDVSAFYLPKLKALGFTTKRRIWSDGSAEELVGEKPAERMRVLAEKSGESEVYVRVAFILRP